MRERDEDWDPIAEGYAREWLTEERLADAIKTDMSVPGQGYIDFSWHPGEPDDEVRELAAAILRALFETSAPTSAPSSDEPASPKS